MWCFLLLLSVFSCSFLFLFLVFLHFRIQFLSTKQYYFSHKLINSIIDRSIISALNQPFLQPSICFISLWFVDYSTQVLLQSSCHACLPTYIFPSLISAFPILSSVLWVNSNYNFNLLTSLTFPWYMSFILSLFIPSFFVLTNIPFISSPYRVLLISLVLTFSYTIRPYLSLAISAMPPSPALSIFLIFSSASRTIVQILPASLPFSHPKVMNKHTSTQSTKL